MQDCLLVGLVFCSARFCSCFKRSSQLQTLSSPLEQSPKNIALMPRQFYAWAFASRRLFAFLVVVRVSLDGQWKGFVARNLAIALPFAQHLPCSRSRHSHTCQAAPAAMRAVARALVARTKSNVEPIYKKQPKLVVGALALVAGVIWLAGQKRWRCRGRRSCWRYRHMLAEDWYQRQQRA